MKLITRAEIKQLIVSSLEQNDIQTVDNKSLEALGLDSLDVFQVFLTFEELIGLELDPVVFDPKLIEKPFEEMVGVVQQTLVAAKKAQVVE